MQIDAINYTIKYKQFAVKVSSIVYVCMHASGVGRVSWRPNKLCINVRVGTKAEPQNEAERADKKCGLLFGAEIESGFVWFLLSAFAFGNCLRLQAYSTLCSCVCLCQFEYMFLWVAVCVCVSGGAVCRVGVGDFMLHSGHAAHALLALLTCPLCGLQFKKRWIDGASRKSSGASGERETVRWAPWLLA